MEVTVRVLVREGVSVDVKTPEVYVIVGVFVIVRVVVTVLVGPPGV